MYNKKIWKYITTFVLMFILSSCTYYSPKNLTKNEGIFLKLKIETITIKHTINSNEGFYAFFDFKLTNGKVDWEIVNTKDIIVFNGYIICENRKVFRELTYGMNLLGEQLNKKEVKSETDISGTIINNPDFIYLQFDSDSTSCLYKLKLTPNNAEGSYAMRWIDKSHINIILLI